MSNFIYGTHPSKWEDVKICTYVICKNELKHVEKWLTYIWNGGKGSDYICVLDTGSSDGTYEKFIEMVKTLGIPEDRFILSQKTFEQFRFDDARNASLELIPDEHKIDVCFCVDLDEYVIPDFWEDLRRTVFEHPDFKRIYYKYEQKPGVVFWYDKIHGVKNWKWKECVHEYLYTEDTNYVEDYNLDADKIYVYHHADRSKSRKFYISLLKLREKESGGDPYGVYYLGAVLSQEEYNYAEAIPYYEKCILLLKDKQDGLNTEAMAYLNIGRCYDHLPNSSDLAEYYFKKAIEKSPELGNAYIDLAQFYVYTAHPELARKTLDDFDKFAVDRPMWYRRPYVWSKWKRCQIIGGALCWEGKYQEAMDMFNQGLADITDDITAAIAQEHGFYNDYNWCVNKLKELSSNA